MILHCGLVLMLLRLVWTSEYLYDYGNENSITEFELKYSLWPSIHNALRLRREVVPEPMSEGGGEIGHQPSPTSNVKHQNERQDTSVTHLLNQGTNKTATETSKPLVVVQTTAASVVTNVNTTDHQNTTTVKNDAQTSKNATAMAKTLDIRDPGVLMRGVIVFGGFLVMAVLYYIFYRKKTNKNENTNAHNSNDANQFRYGVLLSDDRRDNVENSRVPLTMESDDEDDEDLEIFDIEQKKKSMSYVNLQTNDEDVIFQKSTDGNDMDNLLLDIEDASVDPLINWNSNGNKSIL